MNRQGNPRSNQGWHRGPLTQRHLLAAGAAAVALTTLVHCGGSSSSSTAISPATPTTSYTNSVDTAAAVAKAKATLAGMSVAEEVQLVTGEARPSSDTVLSAGYVPAISNSNVSIPTQYLGDSPSGVGNGNTGVTQFPTAQSVASTWDVDLAKAYGGAIAEEWSGKAVNIGLGPAMNIIRLPYGGRSGEYLSEDPYLAGQIAAHEVTGIQAKHVVATAKHFALNNQETDRSGVDVIVSERAAREIYLPAFESCVASGVMSLMGSYNRIAGTYACENPHLLTDILRTDWGFQGWVMSDWFAQHTTMESAQAGLDQDMPGNEYSSWGMTAHYGNLLEAAVTAGSVSKATLDGMATHVLTGMYQVGLFDNVVATPTAVVSTAAHRAVGLQVSEEGTVLLKNDNHVLPLSKTAAIALIGPGASFAVNSSVGGSGAVNAAETVVTPLAGISAVASNVTYSQGAVGAGSLPVLSASNATVTTTSGGATAGFTAIIRDANGATLSTTTTTSVNSNWPNSYSSDVADSWKADYTGYLSIATAQTYSFVLRGSGVAKLLIDGTQRAKVSTTSTDSAYVDVSLTAGVHKVEVVMDTDSYSWPSSFFGPSAPTLSLAWNPAGSNITAAATAAAAADVAVVFLGDSETEGNDHSAYLSQDQTALITAVAAAAKKTVVVLNMGSPLILPWAAHVDAIMDNHYGGEDLGTAIAALLFGDVNPSGKATVTYAASEGQLYGQTEATFPGVTLGGDDHLTVTYSEGINVGYRWFDQNELAPLFPFGHGLSYTSFGYDSLAVAPASGDGSKVTVTCKLSNTGSVTGKEVAQLYVGFPATAGEPPRQLKGFQKVALAAGASSTVSFDLDSRSFAYWGENGWTVDPGTYKLYVGSSSRDIRQVGSYTVK